MSAQPCGCDPEWTEYSRLTGVTVVGHVCQAHQEEEIRTVKGLTTGVYQMPQELFDDPKLKDSNPKEAIGSNKLPFHLWPETATILGALGLLDGTLKYGRSNFRAAGVKASVYYDACRRHIDRWFEGEDIDPDSGLPHLSHALACLAIIVDADAAGRLTDDRMFPGGFHTLLEKMTPHVARLKAKYADKDPKHFTKETR